MTPTASEVIELMRRLIRDRRIDIDGKMTHTLATVAADVYLRRVFETPRDERDALLDGVLDEVLRDI